MDLIKPFGPEIGFFQLTEEQNKKLFDVCIKNQDDLKSRVNNQLVGFIEKEFNIYNDVKDSTVEVLKKEVLEYINKTPSAYNPHKPFKLQELNCVSAWCNIQEVYEYNPPHLHPFADIVCVAFPKIEIDGKSPYTGNTDIIPGCLTLAHGTRESKFGSQSYTITPKTGDVYIFPGDLLHYTAPVWGETDIRISVSFNFRINDWFYRTRKLKEYIDPQ